MLKQTLQPYNNFKFNREALTQDNTEQAKPIFTQEQFSKAADYVKANPDRVAKFLAQDSSKYTEQQQKQSELIRAASTNSTFDQYLGRNITTQETANSYYKSAQESMSPREMDLTKVEERMGREYIGLSNDEKNDELINLATEFENKKQNGTASKTDIMRLEVAYRLLGVINLSEFKQKSEDKGSKVFESPMSESKKTTKTREQRIADAANRVTGWSKFGPSSSIESQIEAINKGGSDSGESKIRVSGTKDKFDQMNYDYDQDLESFTFYRDKAIQENQVTLEDWQNALPRYEKVSAEIAKKIDDLEKQLTATKNGINPFANKDKQAKRGSLQREIDTLKSSLQSSNSNIDKANTRINALTAENSKLTKEIADHKKELDKKYVL